jgi:transposase
MDRYHIVARLNKALDQVRAGEHKQMKQDGFDPILTLLKYNLKSMRAYLLKEEFQLAVAWAAKFIDRCKVMRSKIEPLKKEAKTIRSLILNYFRAKKQLSSGIVEGLNNKAKLTMRKSYGFRTQKAIEIALYHSLGKLPEPPLTHRFY